MSLRTLLCDDDGLDGVRASAEAYSSVRAEKDVWRRRERKEKGQQDFMRLWERMRTLRVTFKALVDGLNRIG